MKKILLMLLVFVFSCQSPNDGQVEDLKKEVMALHDEVMPKMGELRRTRKDLMLQADSLMQSDPERAAMLTTVSNNIADANEGMMDWMRNYEPAFEGTEDEIMIYLEEQKKSIQKVKEAMESSLAKGQEVLEQK